MNRNDLNFFKTWFSDYVKTFYSEGEEDRRNIALKELHTHKVCRDIVRIGRELNFDQNNIMLAETIGLFHDIGRFPQYAEYKSFRDADSVNHGALGAKVLLDQRVLRAIPEDERDMIIQAVKFHNSFSIPELRSTDHTGHILFLRLIRDADKLDIWRVFIEYYESPPKDRASAVGLGLPDTPSYSAEVLSCVLEQRIATLSSLRTLNDFKLLQLSWVYDLNFEPSIRLLSERGYIGRIIATLPQTEEILRASAFPEGYVQGRLGRET